MRLSFLSFCAHIVVALFILTVTGLVGTASAAHTDDIFIAGYASAILEREFHLSGVTVQVKDGVITLFEGDLDQVDRDAVIATLGTIHDVLRVVVREQPAQPVPGPVAQRILPAGRLFDPLIADPRWPHFSMAFHRYSGNQNLRSVGAVSFGETLIFFRNNTAHGQWEFGLQGAVFAVFDLEAESMDLINADYWIGIPVSYRTGNFSALFRLFHQSSHLGDEFILGSRPERVNLSYESLDLKFSYDLSGWLRCYGGGAFMFHREPADLKPWSTQMGIEVKSTSKFLGVLRPIGAIDIKNWEEHGWNADVSARLGVQIESWKFSRHRMQLMFEYFMGHSPNGQFYNQRIEYFGLGTHFYF